MTTKSKKSAKTKKSHSTLPQVDWPLVLKVVSAVGVALLAWVIGTAAIQKLKSFQGPVYKCANSDEGFATVFCGNHLMAMRSLDNKYLLKVKVSKPSAIDIKSDAVQTLVDTSNKTALLDSHQRIVNATIAVQPERVLLLGLGGGGIPLMLFERYPNCELVAVDLYEDAVAITRKFVKRDDGSKIQYVRADAKRYLADAPTESFDVVIWDVAQGSYVPEFINDDNFNGHVNRVMRDDAIYLVNVYVPQGVVDRFLRVYMAMSKMFPTIKFEASEGSTSNWLLTASKVQPPPQPDSELDGHEGHEHLDEEGHEHEDHEGHVHGDQSQHEHDDGQEHIAEVLLGESEPVSE